MFEANISQGDTLPTSQPIMFSRHDSFVLAILAVAMLCLQSSEADALPSGGTKILGVCNRPQLPPNARFRAHSIEQTKFAENETINIVCKENEFPTQPFERTCRYGSWHGKPARCGKGVTIPLTKIEMFKCLDLNRPLFTMDVSQTIELKQALPPNSFHFSRVPENTTLGVKGHDCYKWRLELQKPTEIALLLINVSSEHQTKDTFKPNLTVRVKRRTCKLQRQTYQLVDGYDVFGNYFYCNLDMQTNASELNIARHATDFILIDMEWVAHRAIALDAVFIGQTYKKQVSNNDRMITDCGRLEIERAGGLEQIELGNTYITCNSTMVDTSPKARGHVDTRHRHRYICDANAIWRGQWPKCMPEETCSKKEITAGLDDSVKIEAVGNVYYANDTHWEAIDYTSVSYVCSDPEAFLQGNPNRVCFNGTWTNTVPKCTQASLNLWLILAIVLVITIIVILIVYLGFSYNKRRFEQKLETTREEIAQSVLNETVLGDYYSEPEAYEEQPEDDSVEDYLKLYDTIPAHESGVGYVFMAEGVTPPDTGYTNMSLKIKQSNCESSNALM